MSIDLNWAALTSGPDGVALAETIRLFIHDRFQKVTLPRFIQAVNVHTFEFGQIGPELEIKDICDPLPDFYEDVEGDEPDEDELLDDDQVSRAEEFEARSLRERRRIERQERNNGTSSAANLPNFPDAQRSPARPVQSPGLGIGGDLGSPFLGVSTPGIPGGTSNLNYFHSHFTTGLSGTHTPLAAVAGAHLPHRWPDRVEDGSPPNPGHHHSASGSSISRPSTAESSNQQQPQARLLRERESVSTLATTAATTRPHTRDGLGDGEAVIEEADESGSPPRRFQEPRVEDLQTIFRVKYDGDVKLSLTAMILLDYPMPSFVGIPVKLNITGLSFDGVAVLAYIQKRAHFCFLSPEDAYATLGPDEMIDPATATTKAGGLLQEIKVESEIGKRENGKQVLKNVGKVEKFVLEQVRRIFEDEFVYPSFWTFLV